jgi:hypothetical protein
MPCHCFRLWVHSYPWPPSGSVRTSEPLPSCPSPCDEPGCSKSRLSGRGHDFKPKGARRFRGFLRKPDQSPSPSLPRAYSDRHSMTRHQKPPTRTHLVPSLDWWNSDKVARGDIRASASSFSLGCCQGDLPWLFTSHSEPATGRTRGNGQWTISKSPAAPIPPPTHMVTTAYFALRRRPSISA